MDKYLLISIIVAYVLVPMLNARDPEPGRGLRRTVWTLFAFNVAYMLALFFVYPLLAHVPKPAELIAPR
jgi:hypothetical protein